MRRHCCALALWLAVPALVGGVRDAEGQPAPVTAAAQQAALEQIIAAEDARDSTAVREAMAEGAQRRAGIRALGRIGQASDIRFIAPALGDGPGIRAEAAWALAQAATTPEAVAQVQALLLERAAQDAELGLWEVWGELAAALGRLRYTTAQQVSITEAVLAAQLPSPGGMDEPDTPAIHGAVRGLESLARISRATGTFTPRTWDLLRWSATAQRPAADPRSAWIRRLAMAALVTGAEATPSVIERALADRDAEVRRLGALALAADPLSGREALVRQALKDPAAPVRLDAVKVWGRRLASASCAPLQAAAADPDAHVRLQAIDELGACRAPDADPAALRGLAEALAADAAPRAWHVPAHALLALARLAPEAARPLLPRFATHPTWQVRMYAARAATAVADTALGVRLAADTHPNVRHAALAGLIDRRQPEAVPAAVAALSSPDHQLVLEATEAFVAPMLPADTAPIAQALVEALARLTRTDADTSRDPRLAILNRLDALGARAMAPRLEPHLTDFDAVIAERAATLLTAWTGTARTAAPRPVAGPRVTRAQVQALRGRRLRVTMAALGSFDIALDVDTAPITAVRIAAHAAEGYYNGLTFHRVAPNFVIQGGSPGANEFAGAPRYLRDEVGLHKRGTVGISTRGRDTGDAQFFVNLVDSPRLDHQYTVFGTVTSGMETVDAILEGDVIERIELVGP
jgi:cyclophilin family peptidyl-prolyl cis-trans isomerase/HEAT repeat protein